MLGVKFFFSLQPKDSISCAYSVTQQLINTRIDEIFVFLFVVDVVIMQIVYQQLVNQPIKWQGSSSTLHNCCVSGFLLIIIFHRPTVCSNKLRTVFKTRNKPQDKTIFIKHRYTRGKFKTPIFPLPLLPLAPLLSLSQIFPYSISNPTLVH